ncbi:apolipoprotein d [Plakobranchus ocellatus]|uniref:Apolipoprotein D n=1 Tax=Plakobranchus ocellatus TaxID=259542 RepID=A0AAV4ATN7_9GAST|nr:apolipoprotein d [Plakobranchus ocellatus]
MFLTFTALPATLHLIKMLRLIVLLAIACAVCLVSSQVPSFGGCPTVKTQETLDIQKYLGDWYEIFVFPTTFEKGKCTRARYTLKPDGHIEVYNRGIEDGKEFSAVGDAYVPNDQEPAKLLVRFAEGTPYGKYWVIHTDYDTYTLIYSCSSIAGLAHIEFAWILARNMTLDPQVSQSLKDELASYNVDISKFMVSDQMNCPP